MDDWSELKWKAVKDYCPDKYRDTCYRCGIRYDVVDNIGRFQCSYHPGKYDGETGWSCCGEKKRKVRHRNFHGFLDETRLNYKERHTGCTPCDHNDGDPVHLNDHIDLTAYLVQFSDQMRSVGSVTENYVVKRS